MSMHNVYRLLSPVFLLRFSLSPLLLVMNKSLYMQVQISSRYHVGMQNIVWCVVLFEYLLTESEVITVNYETCRIDRAIARFSILP